MKIVDYLDVTFDLNTSTYKHFTNIPQTGR